jgi:hypothetical protein
MIHRATGVENHVVADERAGAHDDPGTDHTALTNFTIRRQDGARVLSDCEPLTASQQVLELTGARGVVAEGDNQGIMIKPAVFIDRAQDRQSETPLIPQTFFIV